MNHSEPNVADNGKDSPPARPCVQFPRVRSIFKLNVNGYRKTKKGPGSSLWYLQYE